MILNLKQYINDGANLQKADVFYDEFFGNCVFDYISICDGLTKKDIEFLNDKGYTELDFLEV